MFSVKEAIRVAWCTTSLYGLPAIGLTHGGSDDTGLGHRGPESKSIVVPYGFWLFVLSDMVLFSALFATYASLAHATDGGPTTNQPITQISTVRQVRGPFTVWRSAETPPNSAPRIDALKMYLRMAPPSRVKF